MAEDPLVTLRNAIRTKFSIKLLKDGEIEPSFPTATDIQLSTTATIPKSKPTRLRKPGASSEDPDVNPDDFIPIGAVYLAWVLKDASAADYMKQLRENGVSLASVSIPDRKGVVEWLEGKKKELPNAAALNGKPFIVKLSQVISSPFQWYLPHLLVLHPAREYPYPQHPLPHPRNGSILQIHKISRSSKGFV